MLEVWIRPPNQEYNSCKLKLQRLTLDQAWSQHLLSWKMPRTYFTITYYGRTKLFTKGVASTAAVAKDIAQPASSLLTWKR